MVWGGASLAPGEDCAAVHILQKTLLRRRLPRRLANRRGTICQHFSQEGSLTPSPLLPPFLLPEPLAAYRRARLFSTRPLLRLVLPLRPP